MWRDQRPCRTRTKCDLWSYINGEDPVCSSRRVGISGEGNPSVLVLMEPFITFCPLLKYDVFISVLCSPVSAVDVSLNFTHLCISTGNLFPPLLCTRPLGFPHLPAGVWDRYLLMVLTLWPSRTSYWKHNVALITLRLWHHWRVSEMLAYSNGLQPVINGEIRIIWSLYNTPL